MSLRPLHPHVCDGRSRICDCKLSSALRILFVGCALFITACSDSLSPFLDNKTVIPSPQQKTLSPPPLPPSNCRAEQAAEQAATFIAIKPSILA